MFKALSLAALSFLFSVQIIQATEWIAYEEQALSLYRNWGQSLDADKLEFAEFLEDQGYFGFNSFELGKFEIEAPYPIDTDNFWLLDSEFKHVEIAVHEVSTENNKMLFSLRDLKAGKYYAVLEISQIQQTWVLPLTIEAR